MVPESLATVATTPVDAPSHPGRARVTLLSLSPKRWMNETKKGIKDRDLDCGMGWVSSVAQKRYQDAVRFVGAREGTQIVENRVPNKEVDLVDLDNASVSFCC